MFSLANGAAPRDPKGPERVVGAAAHGARDGTGPQRFRVTLGEPCLQRMSALSRRNWSCGTQSPQRRVGGYRDTDSLFWLWAKANKQRLDLLLCLWAAAAAAEQTAYRGFKPPGPPAAGLVGRRRGKPWASHEKNLGQASCCLTSSCSSSGP